MLPNTCEDPTAQAFLTKFRQEFPSWAKLGRVQDDGMLQFETPAPCGKFSLTIYVADGEVTVGAGDFHTHFDDWAGTLSPESVASEANDFVKDIVEERQFFLVRERNGKLVEYQSASLGPGHDFPRTLAFMYRRPGPIRGVSWNGKYDRPFPMSGIRFWFYKLLYFPPARFARFSPRLRRLLRRPD